MTVTATLQPATSSSSPGVATALTLRLRNDADAQDVVHLTALGELAAHTVLQSEAIYLEPGEVFDVPVLVDVSTGLASGAHTSGIEISTGDGTKITAEATISVAESTAYSVALTPEQSVASGSGRHRVVIVNTGNTAVQIELIAQADDPAARVVLAAPLINVDPGATAKVEVRVNATEQFWNGEPRLHPFTVHAIGSDNVSHEMVGTFAQGPRLRPWFLPAAVGALSALLIGALAWFALLRPAVESIADDRAALANEADQEALNEKIAELDAAAAAARALPLGQPVDKRLSAEAAPGESASESFDVARDRVLSVTDIVFQNPDGAVGRISLMRNDEILLESELANFRDLDLHFVAPYRYSGSDTIEIKVDCVTPGPNSSTCAIGTSIVGFVAESD